MAKIPEHTKRDAKILPCKCTETKDKKTEPAKYQDEKYGKGMRVHNPSLKGYVCTVDGDVKSFGDTPKEDKKKK